MAMGVIGRWGIEGGAAMNDNGGLTRIPFGVRERDGELIDVHEAERGARCACRCPSCATPLIARQGEEKVWHFAHRTQGDRLFAEQACDYSFFVSVRLMARQLLAQGQALALPAASGRVVREVAALGGPRERNYTFAPGGVVRLHDVALGVRHQGVAVDLRARVGTAELVVVLTHPGREVTAAMQALRGERLGVLALDLRQLQAEFATARLRALSYRALLSRFLGEATTARTWLFHPREERLRAQALAALNAAIAEERRARAEPVACHCLFCGRTWQEPAGMAHRCGRCGTHLGTRVEPVRPDVAAAFALQ